MRLRLRLQQQQSLEPLDKKHHYRRRRRRRLVDIAYRLSDVSWFERPVLAVRKVFAPAPPHAVSAIGVAPKMLQR